MATHGSRHATTGHPTEVVGRSAAHNGAATRTSDGAPPARQALHRTPRASRRWPPATVPPRISRIAARVRKQSAASPDSPDTAPRQTSMAFPAGTASRASRLLRFSGLISRARRITRDRVDCEQQLVPPTPLNPLDDAPHPPPTYALPRSCSRRISRQLNPRSNNH